jgi:hypothetical protein
VRVKEDLESDRDNDRCVNQVSLRTHITRFSVLSEGEIEVHEADDKDDEGAQKGFGECPEIIFPVQIVYF